MPITLSPDDTIQIQTDGLLNGLRRTLEPRAVERLEAVIQGRSTIAPEDVAESGLSLVWNRERYVLEVVIPASMRRVRNLSLADATLADTAEPTVEPARVSAYLNAETAVTADLEDGSGASLSGQLDGAVRISGVVIETEASFQAVSNGNSDFQRLGTRLVYDDRSRGVRWTLGDVEAPARGFQGGFSTAGVAVFRNDARLRPQQLLRRRGEREFTLLRESDVETFINNRSVRRFRLAPGTYNLADIPVGNGVNDVRIVITDDTGRQDSIEFNLFLDRTLLEPGRNEFSLAAGIGRDFQDGSLAYDDGSWSVTGSYRYGLNDRVTLGANLQTAFEQETGPADGGSDRTTTLIGIETLVASPLGQLGLDLAASQREGRVSATDREGQGFAANLSLVRTLQSDAFGPQSLALVYEYRSENFAVPGSGAISNPVASRAGISWSVGLSDNSFLSLDARYADFRGDAPDETSASVSYSQRLFGSMSLTASGTYTSNGRSDEVEWRLAVTRRLGRGASAQINHDFAAETTRFGLQRSHGSGIGSHSLSLDVEAAPGRTGLNATGSWLGNRMEAGANLSRSETNSGGSSSRLSLRFASAVVYADGAMAVSRPVSDGFAILVPHETIADSQIRLGQAEGAAEGSSGFLGGAVNTRLAAFTTTRLIYSVPDAPAGYDIGTGEVVFAPAYRSGYRVVIGSDYTMTVLGRLIGTDGRPRALTVGELREAAAPDRAPVSLLTNRSGEFGVTGLRPGRWILTFPGDDGASYEIDVPEDGGSLARIGDVLPIVVRHTAGMAP